MFKQLLSAIPGLSKDSSPALKNDYETITSRILEEPVSYEIAVTAISTIAEYVFHFYASFTSFPVIWSIVSSRHCTLGRAF